ncbi:MAG: sulfite exporter TauE/SafE family protein [Caulobacter sp.]|nr:sulfite exporter TauE/SafE family protein [Caulobacter sp.]
MSPETVLWLCLLFGLGAMLYTSVGHAGASAYLAAMALFSVSAATMRPTALVLNIVVASLATYRFVRAGQFNLRLLVPFVVGAIPAAFLAGHFQIPGDFYRPLVGVVLLAAAARLLWPRPLVSAAADPKPPRLFVMVLAGVAIGALSGLTGTGGGIFLSPLILFFGWEIPRKTSGVAAAFILCVSISGLVGNYAAIGSLPPELPYFVVAVVGGALVGTRLGINRLNPDMLLKALGAVLVVAGVKLTFT